jgi:hypothetical protein
LGADNDLSGTSDTFYLCDHLGDPIRAMGKDGTNEVLVYNEFSKSKKDYAYTVSWTARETLATPL